MTNRFCQYNCDGILFCHDIVLGSEDSAHAALAEHFLDQISALDEITWFVFCKPWIRVFQTLPLLFVDDVFHFGLGFKCRES